MDANSSDSSALELAMWNVQLYEFRQTVEIMLTKGLRSEVSPMTSKDWEDIRRKGLLRFTAEQPHGSRSGRQ